MRGTPSHPPGSLYNTRIIPAYAGNTFFPARAFFSRKDHPRVCGEHAHKMVYFIPSAGSSPRMRGTLQRVAVIAEPRGIIPAYAGNTNSAVSKKKWTKDHPRVCGEHSSAGPAAVVVLGSSPRMRGTPAPSPSAPDVTRIIPAYAGNTEGNFDVRQKTWDHPRVCGEHLRNADPGIPGRGSSPRMRGTPRAKSSRPCLTRIIPAYAGNTQIRPSFFD